MRSSHRQRHHVLVELADSSFKPCILTRLLIVAALAVAACQPAKEDVPLLLAQRDAITNWAQFKSGNNMSGWEEGTDVCSWTGVVCSGNTMDVTLGCNARGLQGCTVRASGTLAPELARLRSVVQLGMYTQAFKGTLPAIWGAPGSFPQLTYLGLSKNNLTGTLPATWGTAGAFANITLMELYNNDFTGSLPSSWGEEGAFPTLQYLYCEGNKFRGTIPVSWGELPSLEELTLWGNNLCGAVPASLEDRIGIEEPPPCGLPSSSSTSSSAPVGAIVGAVVGALALVAVAAALALRRRRRRQPRRPAAPGTVQPDASPATAPDASWPLDSLTAPSPKWAEEDGGAAEVGVLPASYITSAGRRASALPGMPPGQAARGRAISLGPSPAGSCDAWDHVASYVASYLALSMQRLRSQAASRGGRSSDSELPPDVQQWLVSWEDVKLERPIGRGSFGVVWAAAWRETTVACKVLLNADDMLQGSLELPEHIEAQLLQEASHLSRIHHPNILNLLGVSRMPPCILTEYCSRGSLYSLLTADGSDEGAAAELTWQRRVGMLTDASRGILCLHSLSPPIIHSDIKSPNLLVDHSWTVKVSDFNLSKLRPSELASVASRTTDRANNPRGG